LSRVYSSTGLSHNDDIVCLLTLAAMEQHTHNLESVTKQLASIEVLNLIPSDALKGAHL